MGNTAAKLTGRVTIKGQVTIPKPVRERLAIAPGAVVRFDLDDRGQVVLRKARGEEAPNRFESVRGCAGPGPSTDEVLAMTRGEA